MSVAEERIRAVEARIVKNDFETAVAFDTDGNVVFEKIGVENEVGFTLDELSGVNGYILTHNHTYDKQCETFGVEGTSPFSSDDLFIAYKQGLHEVRMVVGNELHTLSWHEPLERAVHRFIWEMEELEQDSIVLIDEIGIKAVEAMDLFHSNPSLHNQESANVALTKYYEELKLQSDRVSDFISSNQHIGFTFRKERVLWNIM